MTTFKVGDKPIEDRFRKNRRKSEHWLKDENIKDKVKGTTLHSSSAKTVGGTSPLFHAISYAFNNHCPLVITPDAVWLTILTGLTHHIDTDPEGLRRQFVQHDGKKKLEVRIAAAPGIMTQPPELWEAAIHGNPGDLISVGAMLLSSSFSDQLKDALNPKRYDLLINDFSTTTREDLISSKVTLMGAMRHWFEYKMMLLCGLSTVTVEGTSGDWTDICVRVRMLEEFGLGWWTAHLIPVLDQINLACQGKPDIEFWKAAYLRHRQGSGSQASVSGWINAFYPYVAGAGKGNDGVMRKNPFVNWGKGTEGLDEDDFPLGLVSAPVLVDDHGTEYNCEFYGGLVGVSMDEDFCTVRPESGYAMQLLK